MACLNAEIASSQRPALANAMPKLLWADAKPGVIRRLCGSARWLLLLPGLTQRAAQNVLVQVPGSVRLAVVREGVFQLSGLAQHVAQVVMSLRIAGLDFDRRCDTARGLLPAGQSLSIFNGPVIVRIRVAGSCSTVLSHMPIRFDSPCSAPPSSGSNPSRRPRAHQAGVPGHPLREDLAIEEGSRFLTDDQFHLLCIPVVECNLKAPLTD